MSTSITDIRNLIDRVLDLLEPISGGRTFEAIHKELNQQGGASQVDLDQLKNALAAGVRTAELGENRGKSDDEPIIYFFVSRKTSSGGGKGSSTQSVAKPAPTSAQKPVSPRPEPPPDQVIGRDHWAYKRLMKAQATDWFPDDMKFSEGEIAAFSEKVAMEKVSVAELIAKAVKLTAEAVTASFASERGELQKALDQVPGLTRARDMLAGLLLVDPNLDPALLGRYKRGAQVAGKAMKKMRFWKRSAIAIALCLPVCAVIIWYSSPYRGVGLLPAFNAAQQEESIDTRGTAQELEELWNKSTSSK